MSPKRNIASWIGRYLDYLTDQKHASPETVRAYASDLAVFKAYLQEAMPEIAASPRKIQAVAIRGFVAGLSRSGLERSSIARRLSAVRSMLRHAVRQGDLETNPAETISAPKLPKKLPRDLTVDEVFALLDQIQGDGPADVRDRAILEVLYSSGLRVSELASLRVNDIGADDLIRVVGKGGKTRVVPINRTARQAVKIYLETARPQLAGDQAYAALWVGVRGGPLDARGVRRVVHKRLGTFPHALRHSFDPVACHCDYHYLIVLLVCWIYGVVGHESAAHLLGFADLDYPDLAYAYLACHPFYEMRSVFYPDRICDPAPGPA